MEFKGTSGVWYIDQEESHQMRNDVWCNVISTKNTIGLADVYGDDEEAKANAQLISVAPELLECMQNFVDGLDKGEAVNTKTYNKFKALIEKATKID